MLHLLVLAFNSLPDAANFNFPIEVFDLSNVEKLIVKSAFSDKIEESFKLYFTFRNRS